MAAGARGVGELYGAVPGPGGTGHYREGHQCAGEGGHEVSRAGNDINEGPKFKIKLTPLRAGDRGGGDPDPDKHAGHPDH